MKLRHNGPIRESINLRTAMIRVGPAGRAYKDWEGIVYPKLKPRGFDLVAYFGPASRSNRDNKSPRANHPFGAGLRGSACRRRPASCTHKPATKAASPTP